MRELAILTFVTLDGVMQAPASPQEDTSGGFSQGGWASPYWDEVMSQVAAEAMADPYDVLMGRKTYELFAANFPKIGISVPVVRLNEAIKHVVSSQSMPLSWKNSVLLPSAELVKRVKELKQQSGRLIQVHGSWQLIQLLLANDLIDEFRLWTFPVLVGSGKRLFTENAMPASMQLIKSEVAPKGVVMTIYRRVTDGQVASPQWQAKT